MFGRFFNILKFWLMLISFCWAVSKFCLCARRIDWKREEKNGSNVKCFTKLMRINWKLTLVCDISFASLSEASDICCWICLLSRYLLISSSLLVNSFSGNLKPVSTRRRNAAFMLWPSLQSIPMPISFVTTEEQLASNFASSRHNCCNKLFFSVSKLSKSIFRWRSVCILSDGMPFVEPGDSVVSDTFDNWFGDNSTFWKMFGVRVAFRRLVSAINRAITLTTTKGTKDLKKKKIPITKNALHTYKLL